MARPRRRRVPAGRLQRLLQGRELASNPRRRRSPRAVVVAAPPPRPGPARAVPRCSTSCRTIVDERRARMTVGELFDGAVPKAAALTGPGHLVVRLRADRAAVDGAAFRAGDRRTGGGFGPMRWPAVVLSNHDQPRHASRCLRSLRAGRRRDARPGRKVAATLLLTLRGTPFLYYGEEIGLPRRRGPEGPGPGSTGAAREPPVSRGGTATRPAAPMPWNAEPGGGFSTRPAVAAAAPDCAQRNVASQAADAGLGPRQYRQLIGLRRGDAGSRRAATSSSSAPGDPDVLAYLRRRSTAGALRRPQLRGPPEPIRVPAAPAGRLAGRALDRRRATPAARCRGRCGLAPLEARSSRRS